MKAVFLAEHGFEAHLVRGRLEAEGIPAQVRGEWLSGALGELPATGLVSVWVGDADEVRAMALLAEEQEWQGFDVDDIEVDGTNGVLEA